MWEQLHLLAYRYLRRQGLSRPDAEDLAQETLAAAYLHMDGVARGSVEAWIVAVARNKLRDWARTRARSSEVLGVMAEAVDTDPLVDPVQSALRSSARAELERHLQLLQPRDRALLELRYLRGLSTAEVAKELSLSVSATKVAVHRARARLRGAMENGARDG
jgi:RNA polymerase sigma-70 factor (ECF subfamily)